MLEEIGKALRQIVRGFEQTIRAFGQNVNALGSRECFFLIDTDGAQRPVGGGGLPYETAGDARRLA